MRKGSAAQEDPGQYDVVLVQPGQPDFLWLSGLVKQEDAALLAEQANRAAQQMGKAAYYVVRGPAEQEVVA